jgi:fucose 4-O-acetylase-like acetyltransferase
MLLGLVVHAELVIELTRGDQSLRPLYDGIHVFRMPTFFILGGYFAASLMSRAGSRGFMLSRAKRLFAPLLAAELVIASVLIPRGCSVCAGLGSGQWSQVGWLHLWFLAYLSVISIGFWVASNLWRRAGLDGKLAALRRPGLLAIWFVGAFALTTVVPSYLAVDGTLRMSLAIVPDASLLALFSIFFAFGSALWAGGAGAIGLVKSCGLPMLTVGIWAYLASKDAPAPLAALDYTVAMWALPLGILGVALMVIRASNRALAYLSDSAYWVYLFHPAFLVALAAWMRPLQLPAILEFAVLLVATAGLSLASYHVVARHTIIGRFLSGRRRVRRLVPTESRRAGGRWWLER